MAKCIAFDMDGTIANLYGVNDWKNMLNNSNSLAYLQAEPMFDMQELNGILSQLKTAGWYIVVISWGSMGSSKCFLEETKVAKTEWLDRLEFPYDSIHCIKYGSSKSKSLACKFEMGILIDDNESIRNKWKLGDTLNPSENLMEKLKKLL